MFFVTVFLMKFGLASYFSFYRENSGLWSYLSVLVAGLLTTLQKFSLQNQNLMCLNLLQKGGKKQTKTKHIFQSPEGGLYQEVVVMSRESLFWCATWQNCLQWTNMLYTVRTFYILWLSEMEPLSLIPCKRLLCHYKCHKSYLFT